MTDELVMPIGKHKGKPVLEVMANDRQYVEWLLVQPWFIDKYKPTYNFITQAGPPSDMSPEHNALQVKFLDDDVCVRLAEKTNVLAIMKDQIIGRAKPSRNKIREKLRAVRDERRSTWREPDEKRKEIKSYQSSLVILRNRRSEELEQWRALNNVALDLTVTNKTMEVIADVKFAIDMSLGKDPDNSRSAVFFIELKPTLGDDYPAVLRQMRDQQRRRFEGYYNCRCHVLCYGEFNARGATLEQVKKIFAQANISVIRMDDIA
jgi:hypothetical protein